MKINRFTGINFEEEVIFMANIANGEPTKEFFVEMLTRDIDLNDAILDLLDNCLDGVVRSSAGKNKLEDVDFYKGYRAEITISKDKFSIRDNCGGIPRNTAENYAFRMGRVSTTSTDQPTIGIYGIGMKRAIFKIGKKAEVHVKNNNTKYSVIIPQDWVKTAGNWNFEIKEGLKENTLEENGTEILVSSLNSSIANLWETQLNFENFINGLTTAIKESYSLIIQKGFTIKINGEKVQSNPIELLATKRTDKSAIRPFIFTNQYDTVNVKIAIGFYAPMASDDDIDDINESRKSTYDAGITVVCNDRIVLYNDKSSLTGWGTHSVPSYHTQFIGIKGIVIFESTDPSKLPMTTTKRGIDHSSEIYIAVKDKICEGLKMFTNYTNQWKGRNKEEKEFSDTAEKVQYKDLFSEQTQEEYGLSLRDGNRGKTYRPMLPKPENDKPYRIIRYSKSIDDIKKVIGYFYDDPEENIAASVVGEKCFDYVCEKIKEGE